MGNAKEGGFTTASSAAAGAKERRLRFPLLFIQGLAVFVLVARYERFIRFLINLNQVEMAARRQGKQGLSGRNLQCDPVRIAWSGSPFPCR